MSKSNMPTLPASGDVIVVVGNRSICKPCEEISDFIEKEGASIDVKFVEIDIIRFNRAFPDSMVGAIPKLFYMRDGKVIETECGFGNPGEFKEHIGEVFG